MVMFGPDGRRFERIKLFLLAKMSFLSTSTFQYFSFLVLQEDEALLAISHERRHYHNT